MLQILPENYMSFKMNEPEKTSLIKKENRGVSFLLIKGQQTIKEPEVKKVLVWAKEGRRGKIKSGVKGKTRKMWKGRVKAKEPRGMDTVRQDLMMLSLNVFSEKTLI